MIKLLLIELDQLSEFIADWQGLDNCIVSTVIGIGMLVSVLACNLPRKIGAILSRKSSWLCSASIEILVNNYSAR